VGGSESTFGTVHAYSLGVNVNQLVTIVMLVLWAAVLVTAVYAFVHAAMQRRDAYTAAEKLTKPVWLVILGASVVLTTLLVANVLPMSIAACAAGVYLVDVRPKLLEIQGKSR
jgi:sterol desaturase/sphingolipid hydroxylase (fatty acid hydroxylase superfamily)